MPQHRLEVAASLHSYLVGYLASAESDLPADTLAESLTDFLEANGWRKIEDYYESRSTIQWGFKLPDRDVVWTPSRESANERAAHFQGAEVVCRTLTTTTEWSSTREWTSGERR